jgi:hypothetical protein
MIFSALENSPISVNLLQQANDQGWSLPDGINAVHSCNAGNLILTAYPVFGGDQYSISYIINSISGGSLQAQSPGSNGAAQTTTGLKVETLSPTSNGFISFYSNATCSITAFNIVPISNTAGSTIVYSPINKKWSDRRLIYPDFAWSIYTNTIFGFNGALYSADNGGNSRNLFFGVQYQSFITVIGNSQPTEVKKFKSISIQCNELLITSPEGITTSLGQVSELIQQDFLKSTLTDLSGSVSIYTKEGVYSAQLLRDMNTNLLTGDTLRGNWIMIQFTTVDGSVPVNLYTVGINDKLSKIGVR